MLTQCGVGANERRASSGLHRTRVASPPGRAPAAEVPRPRVREMPSVQVRGRPELPAGLRGRWLPGRLPVGFRRPLRSAHGGRASRFRPSPRARTGPRARDRARRGSYRRRTAPRARGAAPGLPRPSRATPTPRGPLRGDRGRSAPAPVRPRGACEPPPRPFPRHGVGPPPVARRSRSHRGPRPPEPVLRRPSPPAPRPPPPAAAYVPVYAQGGPSVQQCGQRANAEEVATALGGAP